MKQHKLLTICRSEGSQKSIYICKNRWCLQTFGFYDQNKKSTTQKYINKYYPEK